MSLCSGGSANEYLGWNLTAIVRSVQNGDNSPSTAPGIEYLGTLPPTLLEPRRRGDRVKHRDFIAFLNKEAPPCWLGRHSGASS
jgi:hypothetical protein